MSELDAALAHLRTRTELRPEVALVLGSGLGTLAEAAEEAIRVPTADIPGYPRSTVAGHAGELVFGRLEGRDVLFVNGRVHLYEGHASRDATFPVRLAHALGVRRLLLTNAAGGVHPNLNAGSLMLIEDHVNLTFASPLSGPVDEGAVRFPDMSAPYCRAWQAEAEAAALRLGIRLHRGTYAWTMGPSYETPAEIRMFARLGADAVGMSTVPETLQARALGMDVLGISAITNRAAGLGDAVLAHEDVLEVGRRLRGDLERLVRAVV
jgi:purine-nucleoside phosphorylase